MCGFVCMCGYCNIVGVCMCGYGNCVGVSVMCNMYSTTLTEVFPCFFLSYKANARDKLANGPHSSKLVFIVLFCRYLCCSVVIVLYCCY